jgi:hypothetical protein
MPEAGFSNACGDKPSRNNAKASHTVHDVSEEPGFHAAELELRYQGHSRAPRQILAQSAGLYPCDGNKILAP